MSSDTPFETFLLISPKKFSILVINKSNLQKIYQEEIQSFNVSNQINLDELDIFLDDNILKIEKILKNFVKNVYLIIDFNNFFSVRISIKKNNFGNELSSNSLSYILNEAKDLCSKTLDKKKIVHFIIENYVIDEKHFSKLPKNLKCKILSLDLKFICLSTEVSKSFEHTLKRYQISLKRTFSFDYIKEFIDKNDANIYNLSKTIIQESFENEVLIVNKNTRKQGFFEKFFNFFS
tara:strand:- start:130 stop:834 length:705 start_codon:yes stop_codon:yes gene_type:complete